MDINKLKQELGQEYKEKGYTLYFYKDSRPYEPNGYAIGIEKNGFYNSGIFVSEQLFKTVDKPVFMLFIRHELDKSVLKLEQSIDATIR